MKRASKSIRNAASRWLHRHGVTPPRWATVSGEAGHLHVRCTRTSMEDAEGVHSLHTMLATAFDEGMPLIELDLAAVDTADTKLVASLVVLARKAREHRARLLVHPSASVREQVALCHVDPILTN